VEEAVIDGVPVPVALSEAVPLPLPLAEIEALAVTVGVCVSDAETLPEAVTVALALSDALPLELPLGELERVADGLPVPDTLLLAEGVAVSVELPVPVALALAAMLLVAETDAVCERDCERVAVAEVLPEGDAVDVALPVAARDWGGLNGRRQVLVKCSSVGFPQMRQRSQATGRGSKSNSRSVSVRKRGVSGIQAAATRVAAVELAHVSDCSRVALSHGG